MPIHISDKLKHLIPKGEGKVKKHFNVVEFANLLKSNDIIMNGKTKNEILQETENIINVKYRYLELSTELNYSGPRIVNRMSSESEQPQDFQ